MQVKQLRTVLQRLAKRPIIGPIDPNRPPNWLLALILSPLLLAVAPFVLLREFLQAWADVRKEEEARTGG